MKLICGSWGIQCLGRLKFLWCFQGGSLNEGLECGYLSHAAIVKSLVPFVWVVLMYALRERRREVMG